MAAAQVAGEGETGGRGMGMGSDVEGGGLVDIV